MSIDKKFSPVPYSKDPYVLDYLMRSSENIVYGPYESTFTSAMSKTKTIESFVYAHAENSSGSEHSVSAEVSVGGVFKAVDIGATVSTTFVASSMKSTATGEDLRDIASSQIGVTEQVVRDVPEGSFLATYTHYKVVCFTVNGSTTKQYATTPVANIVKIIDKKVLKQLIKNPILVDKRSWESVMFGNETFEFDDIRMAIVAMQAKNIGDSKLGLLFPGNYKIHTTKNALSLMPANWVVTSADSVRDQNSRWLQAHKFSGLCYPYEFRNTGKGTYQIVSTGLRGEEHSEWFWYCKQLPDTKRDEESTRIMLHKESNIAMEWEIVQTATKGSYYIKTAARDGSHPEGWYLFVWNKPPSRKNDAAVWLYVHSNRKYAMEWKLNPYN